MVGFDRESSKDKFQNQDYILAGVVSGFITRSLFQPLDVVKIRFQLQIEPIKGQSAQSKYKGFTQAFRCIIKEEGVRALWKGTVPAQFLSGAYGALQFLSFELISQQAQAHLSNQIQNDLKPIINFACGAVAGSIATAGSFPFDVIRTRLVSQSEPKIYKSMLHGAHVMFRKEGTGSFYKGLLPTLILIMPNTGAQFAFYKLFQDMWNAAFKKETSFSNVLQSTICGMTAGTLAKTLVYPLDLIKKRIQVQGFEDARKIFGRTRYYSGLRHCVSCIFREEGVLGFYKGLWPSVLKAAFTTASHFLFYEQALNVIAFLYR